MRIIIDIHPIDKRRADLGMSIHPYRIKAISDAIKNGEVIVEKNKKKRKGR